MKILRSLITLVLVGQLAAVQVLGATYYVSPTGSSSGDGTTGNPWDFDTAEAAVAPGDMVKLKNGTYSWTLEPYTSGTSGNPITWEADTGAYPIIDGGNTRDNCISISDSTFLKWNTFRGIVLQRGRVRGILMQKVQDLKFENMIVRSNGTTMATSGAQGIMMPWGTNIVFNTVTSIWNGNWALGNTKEQSGFYFYYNCTNVTITNSVAMYNPSEGVGWRAEGASQVLRNNRVVNSLISGNGRQGILTFRTDGLLLEGNNIWSNGATGIQLETETTNVFVRGNTISSNAWIGEGYESGIWLDETISSVVESNVISGEYRPLLASQVHYNIWRRNILVNNKAQLSAANDNYIGLSGGGRGIHWSGSEYPSPVPDGTKTNYFVHNVLHNNGLAGFWRGGYYINFSYPSIDDNAWVNNIISENAGRHEMHMVDTDAFARCDFNLYWNSGRAARFSYGGTLSTEVLYNLPGWRTATGGWDLNSIEQNPEFADAAGWDFNLTSYSPAIDAGGWLTTIRTSGSGTTIPVNDPNYFTAGNAFLGVAGDVIQLEGDGTEAVVLAVDRANRTLTVDTPLTFTAGQGVAYDYSGSAPDIGAFEYLGYEPPVPIKVRIQVVNGTAYDNGAAGKFRIYRTGSTSGAMDVDFTVSGTAVAGTDYNSLGTGATILDGQSTVDVDVTTIRNTAYTGPQTVIVTLTAADGGELEPPTSGTVTIVDFDSPYVDGADRRFEPGPTPILNRRGRM